MLWTTILMALREIRRNTLRSMLTTLGIVIGVASVIALVTVGDGATQKVKANISALGNNLLMISPEADRRFVQTGGAGRPFDQDDVLAVRREIAGIEHVAPTAGRSMQVIAGNSNWRTTVTGATWDYLVARGFEVADGSGVEQFLTRRERSACWAPRPRGSSSAPGAPSASSFAPGGSRARSSARSSRRARGAWVGTTTTSC